MNLKIGIVLIIIGSNCFGFSKERDGGSINGLNKLEIKLFIEQEMKKKLLNIVKSIDAIDIDMPIVQDMYLKMKEGNLIKDIENSKYIFSENTTDLACLDSNLENRASTSVRNELNGEICWDLEELALQNATRSSLLSLAIHEHAHHFGFEDEDEILTKYFTDLIDINPSRFDIYVDYYEIKKDYTIDYSQNLVTEFHHYKYGDTERKRKEFEIECRIELSKKRKKFKKTNLNNYFKITTTTTYEGYRSDIIYSCDISYEPINEDVVIKITNYSSATSKLNFNKKVVMQKCNEKGAQLQESNRYIKVKYNTFDNHQDLFARVHYWCKIETIQFYLLK